MLLGERHPLDTTAAMLATLAGIAMTFIAAGFLFKTFASPLVAFSALWRVLLTISGACAFPAGIPGGPGGSRAGHRARGG